MILIGDWWLLLNSMAGGMLFGPIGQSYRINYLMNGLDDFGYSG